MADLSRNPDRDRPLDFQGFLNNMQDWELKAKDHRSKGPALQGKRSGPLHDAEHKGSPEKVDAFGIKKKTSAVSEVPSTDRDDWYKYLRYSDAVSEISSNFLKEEKVPDAASEKELGNEYFKQKKFLEAIECYSRSIALSPTAVAFANRAMAYLKVKRFEEADNDCTEALHLDDRYVKAYSRRATARKELGKLKSSMEDSEFAVRLEPNSQELRKQYTETKTLYEKEIAQKISGVSKTSFQGIQKVGNAEIGSKDVKRVHSVSSKTQRPVAAVVQINDTDKGTENCDQPLITVKNLETRSNAIGNGSREAAAMSSNDESPKKHHNVDHKHEIKESIQDLASRAASRVMATTAKIVTPKSAYEFEVSWRALSDDCALQANLLRTIPPTTLPRIFKDALSAAMLVDIVKCTSTFVREDTEFAVSILTNMVKVPRFDMIAMCLSAVDRSGLHRIWQEIVSSWDIPADQLDILRRLRPKYCYGG